MVSWTCKDFLFLVVPIFRRAIFRRFPLAVTDIFNLFLFWGDLLFLACLFIAGLGCDTWQLMGVTSGRTWTHA
jgi:hypothetical protein